MHEDCLCLIISMMCRSNESVSSRTADTIKEGISPFPSRGLKRLMMLLCPSWNILCLYLTSNVMLLAKFRYECSIVLRRLSTYTMLEMKHPQLQCIFFPQMQEYR
jgi:hypothetical protein